MKRAMKAGAKKLGKAMSAKKADDHIFEKKWNAVYIERIDGVPFTWKLIGLELNKSTMQVKEKWVWDATSEGEVTRAL